VAWLGRILAALVLFVCLYVAFGGAMTAAFPVHPRGRMIDIGGRHLRLVCEGPADARPVVLLEAGSFGFAADWAEVQKRLTAQGVRSCAYDRAGMGFSDPGPQPRDGIAIASDLEKLLKAASVPGPYVLVGHSMAGLHVRLFAGRNPDKVAGLVLVDAATPEASDAPMLRSFVDHYATVSNLAGWGASAGLFKPLTGVMGDKIGLEGQAAKEKRWAFARGPHNVASAQEVGEWMAAAEQAKASGALDPDWPVAVVMAGPGRFSWKRIQAVPANQSRHGYVENVPAAGHASLLGHRHADAIVRGIDHVLKAYAAGREPRHAPSTASAP
jgi:pimeloyl-ACP methyl ester carboxylesterase